MTTALDAAKYIRDNAMRLVDANASGYFTIQIACSGNFCSSYTSGFAVKFAIYDQDAGEWVNADTLENCVAEVLRRRAVRAQQSQIKLPPYDASTTRLLTVSVDQATVIPATEDDDGAPF